MIDRSRLSSKMKEDYEEFEPRFAKGIANSVALYMLGVIPLLITSAIATKKIIELCMEYSKFKNESK